MHEYIVNLHMHTTYSDGFGSHANIGQAALQAGVDVVLVTDHNVLVQGKEGYFIEGRKRALLLVGEEVHDQARQPQRSHLLVFNAKRELATYAHNPQTLIDAVNREGGICFLAHPHEGDAPLIHEPPITWDDWHVQGYTGLELWNGLSELKDYIPTYLHALFYIYFPQFMARGPKPETLKKWDELLTAGQKVTVVGGSDAHALPASLGPLRATVFPYVFHFQSINTHIFTTDPLSGNLDTDRALVYEALGAGRSFVGYDLPSPTRGFRFSAQGKSTETIMGGEIMLNGGVTLQAKLPSPAEMRLLHNGKVIKQVRNREALTHNADAPGAYRIEAYKQAWGRQRGWVFSNPIYVRG